MRAVVLPVLFASLLVACDDGPPAVKRAQQPPAAVKTPEVPPPPPVVDPLAARIDQFSIAELTVDVAGLPESERAALDKLIAAARLMDPIFDRQAWIGYPMLRNQLAADGSASGTLMPPSTCRTNKPAHPHSETTPPSATTQRRHPSARPSIATAAPSASGMVWDQVTHQP